MQSGSPTLGFAANHRGSQQLRVPGCIGDASSPVRMAGARTTCSPQKLSTVHSPQKHQGMRATLPACPGGSPGASPTIRIVPPEFFSPSSASPPCASAPSRSMGSLPQPQQLSFVAGRPQALAQAAPASPVLQIQRAPSPRSDQPLTPVTSGSREVARSRSPVPINFAVNSQQHQQPDVALTPQPTTSGSPDAVLSSQSTLVGNAVLSSQSSLAVTSSNAPYPHSPTRTPVVTPIPSPTHSHSSGPAAVSVVAPGGGTGINGAAYQELGQDPRFSVEIVGRSRAPYDCYPPSWPHGGPAPNLASFAEDVYKQGWAHKSDAFVFGSRGGQVVLPILWQHMKDEMPPVVCINGGCAMKLPERIYWPDAAVTFLLIGGQDNFRGAATNEEYIEETRSWVPPGNGTTAILHVQEMQHMPQAGLLRAVLPLMLGTLLAWKSSGAGAPPLEEFRKILAVVNRDGWNGRLMYTRKVGEWATDVDFGPFHVVRHVPTSTTASAEKLGAEAAEAEPIEMTRRDELKALFRAAAQAAKPGGGAPLASTGARFHAAAQAAKMVRSSQLQATPLSPKKPAQATSLSPKKSPSKLMLPIPIAGAPGCARSPSARSTLSPCRTPNRLQVPSGGHSPCDATPISKALGMGKAVSPHNSYPILPNYFQETSPVRAEW